MLKVGDKAPDFKVLIDSDQYFALSDHIGQNVILYFYPKDDTPGCTVEACGFQEALEDFQQLNGVVIGISRDSIARHLKFKEKYSLNFPLGSDQGGEVCSVYGAWVEKSMFGKKYFGIQRCTFLVDKGGCIAAMWPKVAVKNHVRDVLKTLESMG